MKKFDNKRGRPSHTSAYENFRIEVTEHFKINIKQFIKIHTNVNKNQTM